MENPNDPKGTGNPVEVIEEVVEHPGGTPGAKSTVEQKEKLYAGVFKTPEELETGYVNSNKEATRMAQEIKRLNTLVQQANTPKEKAVVQDKIDDLTQHFDPETARILSGYFKNLLKTEFEGFQNQSRVQSEFQEQVSSVWEETKKLFPDAANSESKLYTRANEILFERNLAEVDTDGNIRLLTPFAYRIAVEAASVELGRHASENAETQARKGQAGMVQGKGSKGMGAGKLTYEQYNKLSDDEKDAYDKSTSGR